MTVAAASQISRSPDPVPLETLREFGGRGKPPAAFFRSVWLCSRWRLT
jgi:hypothetical protein